MPARRKSRGTRKRGGYIPTGKNAFGSSFGGRRRRRKSSKRTRRRRHGGFPAHDLL